MIVINIGTLASPYIIGDFIDKLLTSNSLSFIFRYFFIFTSVNIFSIVLGYIVGKLYVHLQNRIGYALNRDFIKKVQKSPINYIQNQDTAYLNQRINNDSNSLIIFCIGIIQNSIINILIIIAALILIYMSHTILTAILLCVAFVYFIIYVLFKKLLYRVSLDYQESQSAFFGKLHEQLFNIRFIKLNSLYEHFIQRLNNSFFILLDNAFKRQKVSYAFGTLDQIVMVIVQMILFLIGGREVIAGRLTIGRFIIISSYFNMMLGAIRYFFNMGQNIQSNMASYNRLQELTKLGQEVNGKQVLNSINSIELKNLCFGYTQNLIINDISMTFEKGKVYAILGANGVGKSTLLDIIIGLHTGYFSGQILYNGIPIDKIDMYDLRNRLIGISEQESTLISDTLSYNLNLDKESLIEKQPIKLNMLINKLGLDSYIQNLPRKMNTTINEHSTNLSGGEKQKISLLRVLMKNPNVIIFDEPTSSLDNDTSVSLIQHINEIKDDKIIFIVTHDIEFINKNMDITLIKIQ